MQIVVCSRMMEPSKRALCHVWAVECLGALILASVIVKYLLCTRVNCETMMRQMIIGVMPSVSPFSRHPSGSNEKHG